MKTKKELGFRWLAENRSAQRDSKNSKWGMGVMGVLRFLGILGWETKIDNCPVETLSKNSKWGMGIMRVIGVMGGMGQGRIVRNSSAQRDSRMSNFGMIAKNTPAQRDYIISKREIYLMGLMGHIGPIGKENPPVERYSKFSKLRNRPLSPLCLSCPLAPKNNPAQQDSKMSNLITMGSGKTC